MAMTAISLARTNWLRACYLLMVAGISIRFMPQLLNASELPVMDGVVIAMLSALGLLSIIGLFQPLRLLPVLLFEIAWKLIWSVSVALPQVLAGTTDQAVVESLFAVAFAVPFVIIVPWGYVASAYFASIEPWRSPSPGARHAA